VQPEALDRAVGTAARAVPAFALRIALAAEQDRLAVRAPGDQHQHRFRLREAAEVPEVGILAVRIVRVAAADALRRGRQHQDRLLAGHPHQLPAAASELLAVDARQRLHVSAAACGGAGPARSRRATTARPRARTPRSRPARPRRPGRRLPAGSPPPAAPGPPAPRGPPPTMAVRRRLPGRSRPGSHGTSRTARRCAPTAEPRRPAAAARSRTRGPPAGPRWPRRAAPARRRRRPAATPDPPSPAQASPGPAQRRPRASRTGHRAAPPRPPPCRRARPRREPLPATAMNGTWRASGESPQSSAHVLHFGQSANAVSGTLAIAWSGTLRALFAALLL